MSLDLDRIISENLADVKQKIQNFTDSNIQPISFYLENLELPTEPIKIDRSKDNEVTQINKVYEKLKQKGELNKLTDSFRTETATKVEYQTTGSTAKTIASCLRYLQILHSNS